MKVPSHRRTTTPKGRREFLSDVGKGMLVATLGCGTALEMGLLPKGFADEEPRSLQFGSLEPLVCLMQETPAAQLLPLLAAKLRGGLPLRDLVAAAAFANARTFGGEDYIGFHTLMALSPAYHMALELPEAQRPLPVFKVLYRNTNRIQENGGRKAEVLHPVQPSDLPSGWNGGEVLRQAIRAKDVETAEHAFAALSRGTADEAFNHLLLAVQDVTEVHRVVMPYRAWDLLDMIGKEHAHTLLRQSVRYCVKAESSTMNEKFGRSRTLIPKLFEEHRLIGKAPGNRPADDAWVDSLSRTIFKSEPDDAASAVAAALAEGFSPAAIGEAICLAANQLVLRDHGRRENEVQPGKPLGSVHGDSIGVHACDSANAWRNMARVSNPRNAFASLILGAYQAAFDRVNRGGDFQNWETYPLAGEMEKTRDLAAKDPESLLREVEGAIRENQQARAAAIVHRYGEQGHAHRPVFDLLLRYAISEDGALHAEKYYRTVTEEFNATRAPFRWRQLVALARVTASEYGRPAPGYGEAVELLKA